MSNEDNQQHQYKENNESYTYAAPNNGNCTIKS